jgi:hypothetical protein
MIRGEALPLVGGFSHVETPAMPHTHACHHWLRILEHGAKVRGTEILKKNEKLAEEALRTLGVSATLHGRMKRWPFLPWCSFNAVMGYLQQ